MAASVLVLIPLCSAQTVRLELGSWAAAGASATPTFGVRFDGVKVEGGTLTLDVGVAETARLGVGASLNHAFGPLGNVVFDVWGALRTDGTAEGRVGARGVVGPVAVRLAVLGFSGEPQRFRLGAVTSTERPTLPGPALGFKAGVSARLSRDLVLEADPEVYLAGGVALRAEARLRFLRALGENELDLVALAYGVPGLSAGDGALGVGLVLPRGRAPDWSFTALAGLSPRGVALGGRASVAEALGDVRLTLDAAYEPFRLDAAPLRLRASASWAAPGGTALAGKWEAGGEVATDLGLASAHRAGEGTAFALSLAWTIPFQTRR